MVSVRPDGYELDQLWESLHSKHESNITLCTLHLYSDGCQLFLNKNGEGKNWVRGKGFLLGGSVTFLLRGLRSFLVIYIK